MKIRQKNDIEELKSDVEEKLSIMRKNIYPAPMYDYAVISKAVLEQTYFSKCLKISDYRVNLSETLFWEYYTKYASSTYRFD